MNVLSIEDTSAKGYWKEVGRGLCRVALVTNVSVVAKVGEKLRHGKSFGSLDDREKEVVDKVIERWYGPLEGSVPMYLLLRRAFFWTDPPKQVDGRDTVVGIKSVVWPEGDLEGVAVRYVGGEGFGKQVTGLKLWVSRNVVPLGETTTLDRAADGVRSLEVYKGHVETPIPVNVITRCLGCIRAGGGLEHIEWSLGKYPELRGILSSQEKLDEYAERIEIHFPGWKSQLLRSFENHGWIKAKKRATG